MHDAVDITNISAVSPKFDPVSGEYCLMQVATCNNPLRNFSIIISCKQVLLAPETVAYVPAVA